MGKFKEKLIDMEEPEPQPDDYIPADEWVKIGDRQLYLCPTCGHTTRFRNSKCPSCGQLMKGENDEYDEND